MYKFDHSLFKSTNQLFSQPPNPNRHSFFTHFPPISMRTAMFVFIFPPTIVNSPSSSPSSWPTEFPSFTRDGKLRSRSTHRANCDVLSLGWQFGRYGFRGLARKIAKIAVAPRNVLRLSGVNDTRLRWWCWWWGCIDEIKL